jgi:hypothetical protein
MTTKNKRAIARFIMLIFTVCVIALTLHTISIGFNLALISQENANTETWRINPMGSQASNSVYEMNAEYRNSIYNSSFWYTRWISTTNTFVQLIVGFGLIALSGVLIYMWHLIVKSDLKRFRKRLASKRKNQRVHKNGQTA